MMLLESEIMTVQQNVQQVNVKDLTEAAIQRCSLKKVPFKVRLSRLRNFLPN